MSDFVQRSAAAYGRNYQNLRAGWDGGRQAVGEADSFFADKDIDVLANLALLVQDAVLQGGMEAPQRGEGLAYGAWRTLQKDLAASSTE